MPHCCPVACQGPTGAQGPDGPGTAGVVTVGFAQPTPELWAVVQFSANVPFMQFNDIVTFSNQRMVMSISASSSLDYVVDISPPVGTTATTTIGTVGSAAAEANVPSVPLILHNVTFVSGRFRLFWRNGSGDLPTVNARYKLHFSITYRAA